MSQIYRVDERGMRSANKRALAMAAAIVVMPYLYTMLTPQTRQSFLGPAMQAEFAWQNMVAGFISLPILVGIAVFTYFWFARYLKAQLALLEIEVTDTAIIRREGNKSEKQIQVSEIGELEDTGDNLIVWSKDKKQGLSISKTLSEINGTGSFIKSRGILFKSTVWQFRIVQGLVLSLTLLWGLLWRFNVGILAWIVSLGLALFLILLYCLSRHYAVVDSNYSRPFLIMLGAIGFVALGEFVLSW